MKKPESASGAAAHMNDAMLQESNEIRDQIAEVEGNDVLGRYKIACRIRGLRDAAKYGSGAIQKFAKFIGWSETTAGDYAALATTWPDAEKFAKLAAKPNKNGIPLSWSHFIELMREENGKRRQSLMTKALNEGWTVAKLAEERKSDPSESSDDDTAKNPTAEIAGGAKGPTVTLNPVNAVVNGMTEKLVAVKATCDTDLPKTVASVPADRLTDVMVSLQQGREHCAALCKGTMESYDLAIAQVEERLKLVAKQQEKPAGKEQADPAGNGAANGPKRGAPRPAAA
jgi:hypothetical protein